MMNVSTHKSYSVWLYIFFLCLDLIELCHTHTLLQTSAPLSHHFAPCDTIITFNLKLTRTGESLSNVDEIELIIFASEKILLLLMLFANSYRGCHQSCDVVTVINADTSFVKLTSHLIFFSDFLENQMTIFFTFWIKKKSE